MATNAKMSCPYCTVSKVAKFIPAHIVAVHPDKLLFDGWQPDHYIIAYAPTPKEKLTVLCCLTCKRGMMTEGVEGNGARWVSLHDKKADCKKAHKEALAAFRVRHAEAKESCALSAPAPTPAPIAVEKIAPAPDRVAALWEECTKDKRNKPIVEEVEERCKYNSGFDDDSDTDTKGAFVLDPAEGFRDLMCLCVAKTKQITEQINDYNELEHKSDLMRYDFDRAKEEITNIKRYVCDQAAQISKQATQINELLKNRKELEERIAHLEKINGIYRAKHPELEENPQ
jgi:hypothetical protein